MIFWSNRLLKKMISRVVFALVVPPGILGVVISLSHADFNGFQVNPHAIPLEDILPGGPPRDGIPALTNPKFIHADQATFLSPQDRILGIHKQNQAKAYPILILNWHEIVNDTIAGIPVVITYCPLCGSGIGFYRIVGDDLLTFGVSGLLFQSDVLMYDHQTESLWSQMAMKAVTGKSVGHELKPIFVEHTTWEAWNRRYPETLVLSIETGYSRDYLRDPYAIYSESDRLMFPIRKRNDRYVSKEWVLGIEVNGRSKAYPFSELDEANRSFSDSFNGLDFLVCWDTVNRSGKVLGLDGRPFPTLMSYWFAWYAFHPDTEVFLMTSLPRRVETEVPTKRCFSDTGKPGQGG